MKGGIPMPRSLLSRTRAGFTLIELATHNYHDTFKKFPTGVRLPVYVGGVPNMGTNLWVELLPYFEQDNLYSKWDDKDNRNNVAGETNATQAQVIKILLCPSDPLPEPVVQLTSANSLTPPWSWGFYGMSSYGGKARERPGAAGQAAGYYGNEPGSTISTCST